ncbi:uncharacterized protein IAS62_005985 [Cryptococcus decagattii]|uniref:Uncharacterized protein n=1 Tax=Cryptococcus decagattii TaxID=1859122 RepID=A0ABZ2B4S4_9TREE
MRCLADVSGVCQTTICHLSHALPFNLAQSCTEVENVTDRFPVSFAEPSSYSKPGQPSNALCQETNAIEIGYPFTHLYFKTEQTRKACNRESGRVKQVECSRRDCLVSSQKNGHNGEMVSAPLPAASRACQSSVMRAQMPIKSYIST